MEPVCQNQDSIQLLVLRQGDDLAAILPGTGARKQVNGRGRHAALNGDRNNILRVLADGPGLPELWRQPLAIERASMQAALTIAAKHSNSIDMANMYRLGKPLPNFREP